MQSKKYPIIIIGSIIFVMIACFVTVYMSFDYPVDDDESYFRKYQDVENNYSDIEENEKEFLKYFDFELLGEKKELNINKRQAVIVKDELQIKAIKKQDLNELKIKAKLTRPHTKNYDKMVSLELNSDIFSLDTSSLENGRWSLLLNFTYKDFNKFYLYEFCKNQCKK